MREQRSDRSNDRGALSPYSVISGHQWSSTVIKTSTVISNYDSGSTFKALEGLLSHV